jgi:hypothetical protein
LRPSSSRCECGPSGPTQRVSAPRSAAVESRVDLDHAPHSADVKEVRPTVRFDSAVWPTESPPGRPLFMRTSRRLI